MSPEVRAFVEAYAAKPVPPMTIAEFIRSHNHEIWRKCPGCGNYEDLRMTFYCPDCGAQLDPNFKRFKNNIENQMSPTSMSETSNNKSNNL